MGPVRWLLLVLPLAFVLGLIFERSNATTACADAGGSMRDGVCWRREQSG